MRYLWQGLLIAVSLGSVAAYADDIDDAIQKAAKFYQEGNTQEAVGQLELAAQLIRQQRADKMKALLPEPLAGWEADEAEATAVGGAMLGGGTTLKRAYRKDGKRLTVQIMADSPLVQGMMAFMGNPMFGGMAAQGGKTMVINDQQAVLKENALSMAVGGKYMIEVTGEAGMDEDLVAYAKAIDLKKLADFK